MEYMYLGGGGSIREAIARAVFLLAIVHRSHRVPVDQPLEPLRSPQEAVRVKVGRRLIHGVILRAVVNGRVSLAEEHGLHRCVVGARPLEIDLIAVGRAQKKGGGNSGAGSRSHLDINSSEEDVLWDFNLGCIGYIGHEKDESLSVIFWHGEFLGDIKVEWAIHLGDVVTERLVSEVDVDCFS